MSTGPFVIVDGHNLFIRNYCANPMMDNNGARCGGAVGTVQSIKKLLNDLRPSNILVVWDGEGGSQRRKAIYSAYKEGRTIRLNREYEFGETPEAGLENMRMQRQLSADYLSLLGVPQVRADGVEADDLMAYLAGKMDHPGGCVIVSTDQDMLQLVRERGTHSEEDHTNGCTERCTTHSEVRVFSAVKRKMYDRTLFISEYAVLPENFRLVKALTGDKSDNIEGIRGFGAKTVVKSFPFLTERRASGADVMEAAAKLESAVGKKLIEQKDRFWENLRLVDLSDPMLSATAARQARDAMYRDLGCKEMDLRLRFIKDSITVPDERLVQPFREMVVRRRKFLADNVRAKEDGDG